MTMNPVVPPEEAGEAAAAENPEAMERRAEAEDVRVVASRVGKKDGDDGGE